MSLMVIIVLDSFKIFITRISLNMFRFLKWSKKTKAPINTFDKFAIVKCIKSNNFFLNKRKLQMLFGKYSTISANI